MLAAVTPTNHEKREPLPSSIVVRAKDGRVGDGYLIPVRDVLAESPENGEEHAALQRVRCYRFFAETTD